MNVSSSRLPLIAVEHNLILIVDDEPRNLLLLDRALAAAGFEHVYTTTDPRQVLSLARELSPDLIVLDLHMPGIDGFDLMGEITREFPQERYLPILVLTADATERAKRRALSAGAHDFLTKPFGITEAILRIRNLLETRTLYIQLERQNQDLAERVECRTRELEEARLEVLERLCQAVEFRDDVTGRHTRRVGERSARLAAALGLPAREVDLVRRAAPLHDVGKIATPDAILRKEGQLTPEEFEIMRQHTIVGARILGGGRSDLMAVAETIAHAHHERWDGTGYPRGLIGEDIPIHARIVAIADVFDAVTTPRQYRTPCAPEIAVREIARGAGTHFDPAVAATFVEMMTSYPESADDIV